MGEYELFYETEAVQKKITRLTEEYQRQLAKIVREAMDDAYTAGRESGLDDGYHEGLTQGDDQ